MKNVPFYLGLVVFLFVSGCSTTPQVSEEAIKTRYANQSPVEALAQAQGKLSRANELNFYSPENYSTAEEALKEAQQIAKKTPYDEEILKYTYLAEKHLEKASQVRDVVKQKLAEVLKLKTTLETDNVTSVYKKEYDNRLADMSGLIKDIEQAYNKGKGDKINVGKDAKKLYDDMKKLYVNLVKHNVLAKTLAELDKAVDMKAEKMAPQTFAEAETALHNANGQIENDPFDKDAAAKAGEAFRFATHHLLQVTQEVIALRNTDKDKYESVVREDENRLLLVSKALKSGDLRDKPLDQQAQLMTQKAASLSATLTQRDDQLADVAENNKKLDEMAAQLAEVTQEREKLKDNEQSLKQKLVELALQNAQLAATLGKTQTKKFTMPANMKTGPAEDGVLPGQTSTVSHESEDRLPAQEEPKAMEAP
jgi:hypothetical protein